LASTRRIFFRTLAAAGLFGVTLARDVLGSVVNVVMTSAKKIIVAPGTSRNALIEKNPADLDTRNLEVTPLKDFGTMGLEDHEVVLSTWRLRVGGHVRQPIELSYEDVLSLPAIEKKVLLVCPGVFANHGVWKGISVTTLLDRAQGRNGVNYITLRGPRGNYQKSLRVPVDHVRSNRVFLAYAVNGERLPVKHGFPLRVVAEGYYGDDWVKYVDSVEADAIKV
jgi:DMSO/TMAO reductase YedYZ molybdopterin-dependent catalytic subunit